MKKRLRHRRRQTPTYSQSVPARIKRRQRARWNVLVNTMLLLAIFLGLFFLGRWVYQSQTFKLRYFHVETQGESVPASYYQKKIAATVDSEFFTFDAAQLRRQLLADPWVSSVAVRRVFPNALEVSIKEKDPLAFWNQDAIITQQGDVFTPDSRPLLDLPHFFASFENRQDVMALAQACRAILAKQSLHLQSLHYQDNGNLTLTLTNGLEVDVGRVDRRKRLQQFVAAYPQLRNGDLHLGRVDLRYPNGLAVKWVL